MGGTLRGAGGRRPLSGLGRTVPPRSTLHGRRRALGWAALLLAAVAVMAGGGWAAWYRSAYHVWPGQSVPPRIHWCGRDYDRAPGSGVSAGTAREELGGRLQPVMSIPPIDSHEVFASPAAAAKQGGQRAGTLPGCATLIYLRTGADSYLAYELSGSL